MVENEGTVIFVFKHNTKSLRHLISFINKLLRNPLRNVTKTIFLWRKPQAQLSLSPNLLDNRCTTIQV